MSSTRFNRIKLILSIEDFDDIPLNEYRSQCELNFNNPSLSINQIKEKIRQHYHIPDSCTFTIAPFLPFHPELENKKLITDNPNQEELKRRLECYINVTDLYSAVKEPVIHFFMYPLAFMALPIVFTIQEDYPNKGNIDFPLVKAIQGYPIAFVHYNWTFADLIEQIQRLTFHYIYSNIPGEQSTRDHTQLTVRLFNLDREEHASLVTIVHNESMIIKLSSSSEPILKKLRKHLETLEWTEAPLVTDLPPLKPSSGSSMVRPSDNDDFYTPRQSFSSEDRPTNLKMPTSSSDPIVDILKQEIVAGFLKIGLMVSEETIDKLQSCSTTVHAAMDYYFDNLHLFTSDEPIEKHHGEDDVIIPSAPSAEQDFYDAKEEIEIPDNCNQEKEGELKEEVHDNDRNEGEGSFKGSSPYEIINAEDFEELDYLEADEFFVSSTMAPAPVVPQTTSDRPHQVIPPLPPSPPSLHVPADFISAASSSLNNTMTDNERYRKRFQDIGFELNEVQIEELMLRASTFDGMINYYLSNLALFHSASSPYSSTPRSNRHNSHQHGLQGREERKGSDSPVAEKQCAICFCDCDVEKEMYSLNCCENHYFCLNCLGRLIMIAVNGSEDTAPYIPACPFANRPIADGGCEYVITEKECTQIIHRIINSPSMDLLSYSQGQDLLQKCTRLYLLRGYRQANCIRCPSCPSELEDEAYWVSLPTTDPKNRMMRVDCPTCFASFCSSCLKFPYHYGCKCDEVMPYMRAWMDWMGVGRQRYLQELAKHEERYRHVLEEFQSKKAEHDKKVKEAEDRFKEFQESEVALSRFCRACPHCGCRIEKIDGCDAMVCGRDAHGVSIGLGCGKSFSWNGAPFYRANTADKKMPEEFNMVPPDKAFEIRHEIEEGIALPCDCCGSGIVGPKIQCLNCPSYTVCINCSTNTAYDDLSGLLIGSHHSSHVCKVIFEK